MIKDKFLRKVFILLALAFLFWFLWAVKGIIMYMAVACRGFPGWSAHRAR